MYGLKSSQNTICSSGLPSQNYLFVRKWQCFKSKLLQTHKTVPTHTFFGKIQRFVFVKILFVCVWLSTAAPTILFVWGFSFHMFLLFIGLTLTFELGQGRHLVAAEQNYLDKRQLECDCIYIQHGGTMRTDTAYIHFYGGFNRLNLKEDPFWNPSHMCCSVRFTGAKFRAECCDWGMKARRERVKNGLCGDGGEECWEGEVTKTVQELCAVSKMQVSWRAEFEKCRTQRQTGPFDTFYNG